MWPACLDHQHSPAVFQPEFFFCWLNIVWSLIRLQLHELVGSLLFIQDRFTCIYHLHREALRDVAAFRLHELQLLVRMVTVSSFVHAKIRKICQQHEQNIEYIRDTWNQNAPKATLKSFNPCTEIGFKFITCWKNFAHLKVSKHFFCQNTVIP